MTTTDTSPIPYVRVTLEAILAKQDEQGDLIAELDKKVERFIAGADGDGARQNARIRELESRVREIERGLWPIVGLVGIGSPIVTGFIVFAITR